MSNRFRFFVAIAVLVGWTLSSRAAPPTGFTSVFNGKDLSGWNGRTDVWKVEDGVIVAQTPGLKQNEFLATDKSYRDFVMRAKFRLVNGYGNSGIQFRSQRIPNNSEMIGYQADMGDGWWGALYDESRRNKVLKGPKKGSAEEQKLLAALKRDGWNDYMIRAMDDRITLAINGVTTVEYREPDAKIAREGVFGLQIHSDPKPVRVEFKDVFIQELPLAEPMSPGKTGFLFDEVDIDGGKTRYVVYLPKGHEPNGGTNHPGILFLHGAGERGTDGSLPIKVGLGPAVLARPDFPFVVVFVQAERTWRGGSPDAQRALKVFDEACKKYNVDPDRRHVTGISMGGNGTWEAALARPDQWATATVVCGFGDAAQVDKVAHLPMQLYCGDKDMEFIVKGMQGIEASLKEKNADVKATWYPGMGHNSWDDAYNTDSLYQWMLSQRRGKK
jgi:dienelactone hydrolase